MGLFSFFNREVAMDLGTANSIVIYNDQVVIDEPSIVAYDRNNNKVVAVGKEAQRMDGRTDNNPSCRHHYAWSSASPVASPTSKNVPYAKAPNKLAPRRYA